MFLISLIVKFNKVLEQLSFEEMLRRIKTGYYNEWVNPLRALLAAGNKAAYDLAKRLLLAFTPSGMFDGGRKMEFLIAYTRMLVLDIDGLTPEMLEKIKAIIISCEYTTACFISPSGNGLKVFVRVSTGVEEHLQTFLNLQSYYQTLTGVKIDPSGKDVTRLCFVSSDEHLYHNPNATEYVPTVSVGNMWPVVKPKDPVLTGQPALEKVAPVKAKDVPKVYLRCIEYMDCRKIYIVGQRNKYIFELALIMSRNGISKQKTTVLLLRDYDLNEQEIRNCIKSAYSYKPFSNKVSEAPPPITGEGSTPAVPVQEFIKQAFDVEELSLETALPAYDISVLSAETDLPDVYESPEPEKKKGRQLYRLSAVEELLNSWVETRYNEVLGTVEWRPIHSKRPYKRLSDHDENTWFRLLHLEEQMIPINTLHVLLNSNFSPSVNPFREYFKQLPKWDGKTDYIGQLCDTVKTEDDKSWRENFRKWFVAYATALVVEHVINHTVIVFVGNQGVGKTSWVKLLVPKIFKDYVGTAILQSDSKDMSIMLSECMLIILDEMEGMSNKSLASFKELITRSGIRIRKPFGRNPENLERIATFLACVNHDQILTDPTGSRRFLCSKVTRINYQHTVDIDGAMAQARALYQSGFKYWFDEADIVALTDRNEEFVLKSVEEELLESWVRPVTQKEWNDRAKYVNSQNIKRLTTTQIATILTDKARMTLTDITTMKLGKILVKKGYVRVRQEKGNSYLVRILDSAVVEMNSHTMEDKDDQLAEREDNEQIIRFEEDLFRSTGDDGLPF